MHGRNSYFQIINVLDLVSFTYYFTHPWIAPKDSLSYKVGKVKRVANEGHPAKEVGETEDLETVRHVDDGQEILLQGGDSGSGALVVVVVHRDRTLGYVIVFGNKEIAL